jgi:hypothetical protein
MTDLDLSVVCVQEVDEGEDPMPPSEPHTDSITGSFNDFTGAAQVSMVSGDGNVTQNGIGISFSVLGSAP